MFSKRVPKFVGTVAASFPSDADFGSGWIVEVLQIDVPFVSVVLVEVEVVPYTLEMNGMAEGDERRMMLERKGLHGSCDWNGRMVDMGLVQNGVVHRYLSCWSLVEVG